MKSIFFSAITTAGKYIGAGLATIGCAGVGVVIFIYILLVLFPYILKMFYIKMYLKNFIWLFLNNVISLNNDKKWYIIIILTLVNWSLYKILKEYSWNTLSISNNIFINLGSKLKKNEN